MACEGERPHIQVYDFFCGGGCFSSAIADEHDVTIAFGVDDWSIACGTFRHNHPHATVRGLTLPATWAALRPPHACAALHAHFSPPCCAFSSARHGRETAAEREAGVHLLAWSVEFALGHFHGATFTVENVATDGVKRLFAHFKGVHIGRFDYLELKSEHLGAPQQRTRLVGGTPALIAALKALPRSPPQSAATAFAAAAVPTPPSATHLRGSGRYKADGGALAFALRRIDTEPAFTLTASRALVWARPDGTTIQQLSPQHLAVLMGVPHMQLPDRVRDATRVLGNGIEAHMARAIVAAAREVHTQAGEMTREAATGPARCTIDAAVAAATEDHVLWWRRLNERRERVVDAARSEGVARAKVLRILDEMALAVLQ